MQLVEKSLDSMARRPLAICAASLFAIASPMALATTYNVTSCLDDGGSGTLRYVISNDAVSDGDVVDLSTLTAGAGDCPTSTISLGTGGIYTTGIGVAHNIAIKGPVPSLGGNFQNINLWTVDGSALDTSVDNDSNVFDHTGGGVLKIYYLEVTGGHESHQTIDGLGGCIYSNGGVYLIGSKVTGCTVNSVDAAAKGGGIYAKNGVLLYAAGVYSNTATGYTALGGGVYSGGGMSSKYGARVEFNTATGYYAAKGGGIYSVGTVILSNPASKYQPLRAATIGTNYAYATGTNGTAYGGGIFSKGSVSLGWGLVKDNSAVAWRVFGIAEGGGIYATGDVYAGYTTVTNNTLDGGRFSVGGGIHAAGNLTLKSSTISNNAAGSYGGIDASSLSPDGKTFMLSNSTISGNYAGNVGGAYSNLGANKFYNSTVAFNIAGTASPGIMVSGNYGSAKSVLLQSTLMANNLYNGSSENDFSLRNPANVVFDITSSHNLIRATSESIPGNTTGVCPLLGPLRDNGGLTKTHALLSGSPAIDQGNDVLAVGYDQRGKASINGTLDYPRPSGGADTVPDIGAYEVQQGDVIFNTSFEACVPLF